MNTTLTKWIGVAIVAVTAASCTTNYDAYGNPRQSVDPLAAAAVGGVAGYAIGQNNGSKNYYYSNGYRRPYYGHGPYYGKQNYNKAHYGKQPYTGKKLPYVKKHEN